jgi:hypothetical protein
MSEIDRQRIAAVRKLEELGYRFVAGEWAADDAGPMIAVGDGCYRMVVKRPADLSELPGPPARKRACYRLGVDSGRVCDGAGRRRLLQVAVAA